MAFMYSATAFQQADPVKPKKHASHANFSAFHWIVMLAAASWVVIGGIAALAYTIIA